MKFHLQLSPLLLASLLTTLVSCSSQPSGEWITKAPAHEDDLGWIITGADSEKIEKLVKTSDLQARSLHKASGTFEVYGLTGREVQLLTGVRPSRNQFWPLGKPVSVDSDQAKQHLEILGVKTVHKWNLGAGVKIGVIDTGINLDHPEFDQKLTLNDSEIADNQIDDDDNGLIDDISGWNFSGNNTDLSDPIHHGTSVASLIVSSNNGVAPMAEILPLKVLGSSGRIDEASVIAALRYAADQKVNIINISLGKTKVSSDFLAAVKNLEDKNITLVAASGNDSKSCEIWKVYPAAMKLDFMISVAATGIAEPSTLASYSNYGECVDFAIPAGDFSEGIPAAMWANVASYSSFNGTSAAAPIMSGLVALIKSQEPELSPVEIKSALKYAAQLPENLKGFVQYGMPKIDSYLPPLKLDTKK